MRIPFSIKTGLMCRVTFIVDIQRTTAERNGAVVNDSAQFGRNLLSDQTRERRCPFTVEIRFQAVTDCFMQQNPGPAGPEHDFHWPGGRFDRSQLQNRLARGFRASSLRRDSLQKYLSTVPRLHLDNPIGVARFPRPRT